MKRHIHYERAFEDYLQAEQIPYVAVDEAKRAAFRDAKLKSFDFIVYGSHGTNWLVDIKGRRWGSPSHTKVGSAEPPGAEPQADRDPEIASAAASGAPSSPHVATLKLPPSTDTQGAPSEGSKSRSSRTRRKPTWENWITQADRDALAQWEQLFGEGFSALLVFAYWINDPQRKPPAGLTFRTRDTDYIFAGIPLATYTQHARLRSPKWGTINMPRDLFAQHIAPIRQWL